jgi:phage gp16-like protein
VAGEGGAIMTAQPAADRRAMLGKVHLARKQMGLDDETYRGLLERVVGQRSCATCSDGQLHLVLAEFARLGWTAKPARTRSDRAQVRMIYAIWADIRPLLEGGAGEQELRSFVRRQTRGPVHPDGVDAPEWLDGADARAVIEGLKGWLARLRKAREAVHA